MFLFHTRFNADLGFYHLNGGMDSLPACPLQQHAFFAGALRRLGQPVSLQEVSGAAPVVTLRRFGINFASRGPIWGATTALEERAAALRQSQLRLINADSEEADVYRHAGFRMISAAASTAELDICGTSQDQLMKAKPKWRNAWRRACEAPFRTEIARFDLVRHDWLLAADQQQQRIKGFRAMPHAILLAYAKRQPRDVIVLIAYQKRNPIAAMLFLLHRPVATYHLGWSNDIGRSLRAHHRMMCEAADWLRARQYQRLDLGAVDTENAPGLARFKNGTGASVRRLGGTWLRLPGL